MEYLIPTILLLLIFIGAAITSFLIYLDNEIKNGREIAEILETLGGRNIKELEEIEREKYKPPKGYVNWNKIKDIKNDTSEGEVEK